MTFTGTEDHSITLNDAKILTKNYRNDQGEGAFLAGYFGKKAISDILGQTNCVGVRIYMALDSNGDEKFVIVGVDANEDDLYNGTIAEFSIGCPPRCPSSSPLAGT